MRESAPHPVSGLRALVEDDGDSVWLYLVDGRDRKIRADCWLYNRRVFEAAELKGWPRDRPPPAPSDVVGPEACWAASLSETVEFIWSRDGGSVAVRIGETLLGYVVEGNRRGHSRYLRGAGPWGSGFDQGEYDRVFG